MKCISTPGIDPRLGVLFGIFCKMIHPACGRRKRTHAARSAWAAAQNDDFLCIPPSCHPEQREALAKDLLIRPRCQRKTEGDPS